MKKLLSLFIILLLISCNDNKVYKVYDTIEDNSEADNSNVIEQFIPGSTEEKVAITRQIIDGANGFEVFAEDLGWKTNKSVNITGDSNAIKGDTIRFKASDVFPNNFRTIGKDSRSQFSGQLEEMIYEYLLKFDTETFKMEPALATHWKMLNDSLTYKFRINPNAKFSDGNQVTAIDVVESFNLLVD